MRTYEELEARRRVVFEILHESWCVGSLKSAFEGEMTALKFALGMIDQNTELTWSKGWYR